MDHTCNTCNRLLPSIEFEPAKKRCRSCKNKWASEFYRNNPERRAAIRGRYFLKIKSGRMPKEYYEKSKLKTRQYASTFRERKLASRPAKAACQKCNSIDSVKWLKGSWHCFGCQKSETEKNLQVRNRIYYRKMQIEEWASRYEKQHGIEVSLRFKEWANSHRNPVRITQEKLNALCLPIEFAESKQATLIRITALNRISKLPAGHVGWECNKCGIKNDDCAFFDIDHVIPRRKKGNGLIGNLQVICPNCHRTKTRLEHFEALGKTPPYLKGIVAEC